MEEINIQKKIKSFRNSSIIHSIINLVLVSCHFIIYIKLFWISYNTKEVYYFLIFIILFLGIIPIFLAIFITFIKITKTIGIVIKFVLKYFILLEILISILSSISLSENEKELSSFVYSCPFLYEINDIDNIFEFYIQQKKDKIKENCSRRRCFINNYSFDLDKKIIGIYKGNSNGNEPKNNTNLVLIILLVVLGIIVISLIIFIIYYIN